MGTDGRAKRRLIATPQQISSVAMSPDSTRIAFTVAGQLWAARSSGSGSHRMINGRGELARWAPGGRRVTLIDELGISAIDVRTGRRERIFVLPDRYDDQGAADYVWSPDGRFLAVGRHDWRTSLP